MTRDTIRFTIWELVPICCLAIAAGALIGVLMAGGDRSWFIEIEWK